MKWTQRLSSSVDAARAALHGEVIGRHLEEIGRQGYTLLRSRTARLMSEKLRHDILDLSLESIGQMHGKTAALLLGRRPSFAEAVALPELLAVAEAIVGKGLILSQVIGSVRTRDAPALGLHVDNSWFPEPFPEWELSCTACWVLDEFTQSGGCTYAIPGSHQSRRHPTLAEREQPVGCLPLQASRGSIWVWTGSLWHGNYPRQLPGERVALHITFNRLGIQPIEDYRHLDATWLAGQPRPIASLLGRRALFGSTTVNSGGVDPLLALETYRSVHGRDGY
jgi:hypothetical protein